MDRVPFGGTEFCGPNLKTVDLHIGQHTFVCMWSLGARNRALDKKLVKFKKLRNFKIPCTHQGCGVGSKFTDSNLILCIDFDRYSDFDSLIRSSFLTNV